MGQNKALKWRAYYDQFRYDGIYNYVQDYSEQNFDGAAGDWVGSQVLYQQEHAKLGTITAGAEVNIDIRNTQYQYSLFSTPEGTERQDYFLIRRLNANYGLFIQDEWKPAAAWTIYLGGRFDNSRNNPAVFSPRAAVVYKRNTATYKVMYGRAFRNPSTFERYYSPNPSLNAERIQSIEVSREQQLSQGLRLLTSVFHYSLSDLIQGVPVDEYTSAISEQIEGFGDRNGTRDERASIRMARYHCELHAPTVRGVDDQQRLENSPVQIGQFRAAVPFAQGSDGGGRRHAVH